jgi:flavin reductase (DIM6/NTAB) family NADH-FMN oxidoreductase RutF
MTEITSDLFKKVLGRYATGVTIVTTLDEEGNYCGLTANSFNSVSLNPPLVLFSISNGFSSAQALKHHGMCGITILSSEQKEISNNFAFKHEEKFKNIDYHLGEHTKLPIINSAIGWIEGQLEHVYQGGDHNIFVIRVIDMDFNEDKEPLIYYKGKYEQLPSD